MARQEDKFDLINNLKELFNSTIVNKEVISEEGLIGYNNLANTIMVIPKLKGIKEVIEQTFQFNPVAKIPNLSYNVQFIDADIDKMKVFARLEGTANKFEENSVKLSAEYMKMILKLCTNTKSEGVLFKFRKDYPLWVETDEMIVILAPRVGDKA